MLPGTRMKTTNKCDGLKQTQQKWFKDGRYLRNETEFVESDM